jgi:hypothetical protein
MLDNKSIEIMELTMKKTIFFSSITLIAMTVVLVYGFTVGDFSSDGQKILNNPWGIVSLVDLYAGFILFSIWIAFREKSPIMTVIWIVLMMVFGFWTGSFYVLYHAIKAKGDWRQLLLGKHHLP